MGISRKDREYIFAKQQWKCNICSILLTYTYETDHIIPKREGGTDVKSNLQALCPNCHAEKSIAESTKPRKNKAPIMTAQERNMGFVQYDISYGTNLNKFKHISSTNL